MLTFTRPRNSRTLRASAKANDDLLPAYLIVQDHGRSTFTAQYVNRAGHCEDIARYLDSEELARKFCNEHADRRGK